VCGHNRAAAYHAIGLPKWLEARTGPVILDGNLFCTEIPARKDVSLMRNPKHIPTSDSPTARAMLNVGEVYNKKYSNKVSAETDKWTKTNPISLAQRTRAIEVLPRLTLRGHIYH
jgi:hypothetical protein